MAVEVPGLAAEVGGDSAIAFAAHMSVSDAMQTGLFAWQL